MKTCSLIANIVMLLILIPDALGAILYLTQELVEEHG